MVLKPAENEQSTDGSFIQDLLKNENTELIEFKQVDNQIQKLRCLHHCGAVVGPINGEVLKIEMLVHNYETEAFGPR